MAAADPMTLDAVLIAQAQRTAAGMTLSSSANPVGNGIPMANPTGLTRATETSTLIGKGRLTPASVIGGRMAESTSTAARISIRILLNLPISKRTSRLLAKLPRPLDRSIEKITTVRAYVG